MKTVRFIIVIALTLAAILAILSPTMLAQALPPTVTEMLRLEDFPLLGSCTKIASQLMSALHGGNKPTIEIVTSSIGEGFMDELLSLLMVAVLSIPVSLILAFLLYRPLAENGWKLPLYASLYLCSMILAWALYRKVYFAGLIEGLIKDNIEATIRSVGRMAAEGMVTTDQKILELMQTVRLRNDDGKEVPLRYGDIAILMRSLPESLTISSTLAENGIPCYAQVSGGYFDSTEVLLVLQCLSLIDNGAQDIPLAAVMLSPIGGFSPDSLALLRAR